MQVPVVIVEYVGVSVQVDFGIKARIGQWMLRQLERIAPYTDAGIPATSLTLIEPHFMFFRTVLCGRRLGSSRLWVYTVRYLRGF